MKNYLIAIIIGILLVGGIFVFKNMPKESKPITQTNQVTTTFATTSSVTNQDFLEVKNYSSIFQENKDVCEIFPQKEIENLLGKKFHSSLGNQTKTSKYTVYACEYYQEPPKYNYDNNVPIPSKRIVIDFEKGDIKGIREVYKISPGSSVKQDKDIPFPHQLEYNSRGELQGLRIFLADDLDLTVGTSLSNLTQEEALAFVKQFALYLKGKI